MERRRTAVMQLYLSGVTSERSIQKALERMDEPIKVTNVTVHNDIQACLKELHDERIILTGDAVITDIARIDVVISANWGRMRQGDTHASKVVLKAIERRASLLGLDAPIKTEDNIKVEHVNNPTDVLLSRIANIEKRGIAAESDEEPVP